MRGYLVLFMRLQRFLCFEFHHMCADSSLEYFKHQAKKAIVALEPLSTDWEIIFCDDVARLMHGPQGQKGEVSDSVIALRRKK